MTHANTAIGLGSNLGEPRLAIQKAQEHLQNYGLRIIRCSSLYLTEPVNCEPGTPDFVNAVLIGYWSKNVADLLGACKDIEEKMGRPRNHSSKESRIIDIDILMIDDEIIQTEKITLPHPQLTKRLFVLKPFCEIAPDWIVPGTEKSICEICNSLITHYDNPKNIRKIRIIST